MSVTMNKELLVRMPLSLYKKARTVCSKEYKSLSALVRELLLERIDATLTEAEKSVVEKGSKSFHKGEGVDWRAVRRG